MKQLWWYVLSVTVVLVGVAGGCGWSGYGLAREILRGEVNFSGGNYQFFNWCTNGLPIVGRLGQILDGKYIVLLQNNRELRATGGFVGSYVRVIWDMGKLVDLGVQDIYVPDGKLVGHVEPPYPVQESFRQGWWKLRDANWDPDFASAAATVKWFLEQGGETGIKGIAAVNLDLIQRWLGVIGWVNVPEFGEVVNADNMYSLAQKYAETSWYEGSKQKQEFLGAVGEEVVKLTRNVSIRKYIPLMKLFYEELSKKQMQMWFEDEEMRRIVDSLGWGGRIEKPGREIDLLYVVESNLGANKSNCCVERRLTHDVKRDEHVTREKLRIEWMNTSEYDSPVKPVFWGGNYLTYVRVVLPEEAKIQDIKVRGLILRMSTPNDFLMPNSLRQEISWDMYNIEKRSGHQIVGFWVRVEHKDSATAELEYESVRAGEYKILVKRQPGIEKFGYKLTVDGKTKFDGFINRDILI
ncbi:hypothetical protein A2989_02030 [Candidatus Amesbacteria bacterium RIFCSPLOWO2_01_FULL_48_25]|uniref:DUF4012 domain-containing protein n=1 Tax=Candidatus Amesbacteria bacterium RIFCSPLOWO2_01_FULL_48_25 TaxID=1797259 RepID=A0A1F4Z9R8_9BACT|nr:MAG: hypothetical protein A2989_02030 [Candidatus Amesbacteria bacterium RIFCSPLOWO2_01_FULL_48_25]